jgi:hypothetical protein
VASDEVLDVLRHRHGVDVATRLDFLGKLSRDVFRPTTERVEGNDAHGIVELTGDQIGDDGLEVAWFDLGFPSRAAAPFGNIVDDEIDDLRSHTLMSCTSDGHRHRAISSHTGLQYNRVGSLWS